MNGEGIVVLSLFDGMSCGRIALERLGIKVKTYYASEIDKYAIKVSRRNYPDIIQLGDVRNIRGEDLPKIDLLIGGSPCQGFSTAGGGMGFDDPRSVLFFEYVRLLRECAPKYFLLENVRMKKEWLDIISYHVGIRPININSRLVSAQNRDRLYWTNIGAKREGLFGDLECKIPQPADRGLLLRDILESEVDEKYFLSAKAVGMFFKNSDKLKEHGLGLRFAPTLGNGKSKCVTTKEGSRMYGNFVIQLNPSTESDGKEPYQNNRVYSIDGKSPCLTAGLSGGGNMIVDSRVSGVTVMSGDSLPFVGSDKEGGSLLEFEGVGGEGDKSECDMNGRALTLYVRQGGHIVEIEPGDCVDIGFANDHTRRGRRIRGKSHTLQAVNKIVHYCYDGRIRRLTPLECERLQTVPDGYTGGVSDTQRYKMLGNGWTVDVIAHIFSFMEI